MKAAAVSPSPLVQIGLPSCLAMMSDHEGSTRIGSYPAAVICRSSAMAIRSNSFASRLRSAEFVLKSMRTAVAPNIQSAIVNTRDSALSRRQMPTFVSDTMPRKRSSRADRAVRATSSAYDKLRFGEMTALRSGQRLAIPTKTSARLTEFKTYPHNTPDHLRWVRSARTRLIAKVHLGGRASH
jgi:hypothetical protein